MIQKLGEPNLACALGIYLREQGSTICRGDVLLAIGQVPRKGHDRADKEVLRSMGLSYRKAEYLKVRHLSGRSNLQIEPE